MEAAPLVGPPVQSALKQPGRSSLLHLRQQKEAHFSLLRNNRKGCCLFSTASFIATVKNEQFVGFRNKIRHGPDFYDSMCNTLAPYLLM